MASKITNALLGLLIVVVVMLTFSIWQLNETSHGLFQVQKFLLENMQHK
ncbi:hypothetical protein K6R49_003746 [Escherichia coli]|nr:hypothetical protein [Escherichia coli]MBJ0329714.1 hypothetical protein [Escherichia coli]